MKNWSQKEMTVLITIVMAVGFLIPVSVLAQRVTVNYPYLVGRVTGVNPGLSGHDLNGISFNGNVLDDKIVVSVSLNDVELDGEILSVNIKDSGFYARTANGKKINKRKFEGAYFKALLDDNTILPLRIDGFFKGDDQAIKHIDYYNVSFQTEDGWLPLCGEDEYGSPIGAIPLNGRWDYSEGTDTGGSKIADPTVFTFGCRGYVLAKCVEGGYWPWKTTKTCTPGEGCEFSTMEDHHQACTRMLRADYCGDGTSYTEDGIEINVYDGYGVRSDILDWEIEAEWDADGAICATQERAEEYEPQCASTLYEEDCGNPSHFADGALLISEVY